MLGKVKGEVHAGAAGDEKAFIFSLGHRASHLRVASEARHSHETNESEAPTIAFIEDEEINLIPFAGKVPR